MIRHAAALALLLAGGAAAAQSPGKIRVHDAGPGTGPALLAQELTHPYHAIAPASSRYVFPRDSTSDRTLIVLGRDVVIEGKVQGDVVVIGGDLYMHPGGRITGRAISIGGGIYESSLASIGKGTTTFVDFTYSINAAGDEFSLDYQATRPEATPALSWPDAFGFRIPMYDRADGLSLSFGPRLRLPDLPSGPLEVVPRVTYRSQLGKFDPSIAVVDSIGRRMAIRVIAETDTRSNETWISSDFINSLSFLGAGSDGRNYYRADRVEATLARRWESVNGQLTPFIGGQFERASPVRPDTGVLGGPWTFLGRHNVKNALRPNPQFTRNNTASGIVGARWEWIKNAVSAHVTGKLETGAVDRDCADACPDGSSLFTQATLDGFVEFPTFGSQSFRFDGHAVASGPSRNVPMERWAYFGGSGTMSTLDMLSLGGDQLVFADFRYNIPIERIALPIVGPPTITLREALGGADVGRFPGLHQAFGLRIAASFAYAEILFDPMTRHASSGVGISLGR